MSTPQKSRPGQLDRLLWLTATIALLLIAAFVVYVWSEKQIDRANDRRHHAFVLADQLRQSSDDLTRMARTYVVTQDARYKQAYNTILDIRDGKAPRPAGYDSVYWDMVLVGAAPAGQAAQPATALLDATRVADFTDDELHLLAQAKKFSDELTRTERLAMAMVDDASPTALAAAQSSARTLLHDSAYHATKAAIMQPIGEVLTSVDKRTALAVRQAERQALSVRLAFVVIAAALMLLVLGALRRMRTILGGSVDTVYDHLARISQGDFSANIPVAPHAGNSVLGWLSHTQSQLQTLQLKRAHERQALIDSQAKLSSIIQSEPACIKIVDEHGLLVQMNPAGLEMIQADDPAQVVGQPVLHIIAPEFRAAFAALHQRVLAGERVELEFEIVGLRGTRRWMHTHAVPLRYEGRTVHLALTNDVTQRKHAEKQIQQLAFYDQLTGLPNRHLLMDRLGQTLAGLKRRDAHGALILLDLDNFKSVNDTLGHLVGDQLLVEVAHRLSASIREGDTVARFGGDEFVIIVQGLEPSGMAALQAEAVACKILNWLKAPYTLQLQAPEGAAETRQHYCSASLGICLLTDPALSIDELLKRADTAMYQAKASGRNTLRFYDAQVQSQVSEHATLEGDLRSAVQLSQLVLYYQPQVTAQGSLTGAEALVRWQHPQRGLLMPGAFIALAEESGLILDVGQWVLETACAQLAVWATHEASAALSLAVNVSARQFQQDDFVEQVVATLERMGANPRRLKLELTESMLIHDVEATIGKMAALKAVGVGFSLDDFGTGYSSLSHLKRLPLDQLKIDQSFVRHIAHDSNDASIAKMILALAQSLGLGVIAEGVEQQEQADFLKQLGCNAYQGYLFGRPMPVDQLQDRIRDWTP